MVYRVYVEKRPELAQEARALLADLRGSLQITNLTGLRLINRYDVEHIDEALFAQCVRTVFSEPQVDRSYSHLEHDDATLLAVEYLPGQFDQRADSAAQCIQILSQGERPTVRTAKVYALYGALTEADLAAIRRHLINPVESREAALDRFETLDMDYAVPPDVPVLEGFRAMDDAGVAQMLARYGLAMDADDLRFCQAYFCEGGPRPDAHRAEDDRHLLVRPLPPHHLQHHHRGGPLRGCPPAGGLWPLSGHPPGAGPH